MASLICLMGLPYARAQTYSLLKSFGAIGNGTGGAPETPVVRGPDGTIYGTTAGQGTVIRGSLFRMNGDGTDLRVLRFFTDSEKGSQPHGLILSGDTLFGTLQFAGQGLGLIFRIKTDGSEYAVVREFQSSLEGGNPTGDLVLSGTTLYGTTERFGAHYTGQGEGGTIYRVNTDGSGFQVLHSFSGVLGQPGDGANPSGLVLQDGTLYGAAPNGGNFGAGTVFKTGTEGGSFAVLRHFNGGADDGFGPRGRLAMADHSLFGTTSSGGNSFAGTLYKLNADGTGFSILKHFGEPPDGGMNPMGGVTLAEGGTLYGTTFSGQGAGWLGTLFKVNTDGNGFAVVRNFDFEDDHGYQPMGAMTFDGTALYGTTVAGGADSLGTVFKFEVAGESVTHLASFRSVDLTSGSRPDPTLILSGETLYGLSQGSGTWHLFRMGVDGSAFANIVSLGNNIPLGDLAVTGTTVYWPTITPLANQIYRVNVDGSGLGKAFDLPAGTLPGRQSLVADGTTLYGSKASPDSQSWQLYRVNTNGTGFTAMRTFPNTFNLGPLLIEGATLYGTTVSNAGHGTVFRIATNGSGYMVLKQFQGPDGSQPAGVLALREETVYGVTREGGVAGMGTVYKVNTNGSGFGSMWSFSGDDGVNPEGGLAWSGPMLYGTTSQGVGPSGSSVPGTVFQINATGSGFRTLVVVPGVTGRVGSLLTSVHRLYGTTERAGALGFGSVFEVDLTPPLTITASGADTILSWPSFTAEFDLEASLDLRTDAWAPVATPPADDGENWHTVVSAAVAPQRFFRLRRR